MLSSRAGNIKDNLEWPIPMDDPNDDRRTSDKGAAASPTADGVDLRAESGGREEALGDGGDVTAADRETVKREMAEARRTAERWEGQIRDALGLEPSEPLPGPSSIDGLASLPFHVPDLMPDRQIRRAAEHTHALIVQALDTLGQRPVPLLADPVSARDLAARSAAAAEGAEKVLITFAWPGVESTAGAGGPLLPDPFAQALDELEGSLGEWIGGGAILDAGVLTPDYRDALHRRGAAGAGIRYHHDPYMLALHHGAPHDPATPLPPDLFCGDGLLAHAMGAGPVEEIAWTLATTAAHLHAHRREGTLEATLTDGLCVRLGVSNDYLIQIAKIRAIRPLLRELVLHLAGPDAATALPPARIHAVGSPNWRTGYDVRMDLMRAATQSMAAMAGGADRITPLGPVLTGIANDSDSKVREIGWAVRLVHILREEGRLAAVADPGFGAGLLEDLTRQVQRSAWSRFVEIETRGGWLAAVLDGTLSAELLARQAALTGSLQDGSTPFVGVNRYAQGQAPRAASDHGERPAASPFGQMLQDRLDELRSRSSNRCTPVPVMPFAQVAAGASASSE